MEKLVNPIITKIAAPVIALIAVVLTFTTIAALSASQNIDLNGTITTVNVDVYHDLECRQPCSSINVGTLNSGATFAKTIYVKNTGTVSVTLSMTTSNWSPSTASNYLDLSWNRQNQILKAGESCEATLVLTVAENTNNLTTFSSSITIIGIM